MNAYLQICRPVNVVMAMIGAAVACFMSAGTDVFDHIVNVLICLPVVAVFVAGGNSLNDYIDVEIDKTSHPERPVPMGKITPIQARNFGIAMLILAVVLSVFTLDAAVIVIVAVAAALMFGYEMGLKQRGFVGNLTIAALTGMVFLLGGAIVSNIYDSIPPCVMAACVTVGREIAKDIEDMEGDVGRHTLPMAIGKQRAAAVAAVFFIVGPVMSIIPMFLGMYGPLYYVVFAADAFFLAATYLVLKDPHKGQKNAKFGMLFGLLAFVLGVFRF